MATNTKKIEDKGETEKWRADCGENYWRVRGCYGRPRWVVTSIIVRNREKTNKKKKEKTNCGEWRSPIGMYRIKFNDVLFRKRNRVSWFVDISLLKISNNVSISKPCNVLLPSEERCRAVRTLFLEANTISNTLLSFRILNNIILLLFTINITIIIISHMVFNRVCAV